MEFNFYSALKKYRQSLMQHEMVGL